MKKSKMIKNIMSMMIIAIAIITLAIVYSKYNYNDFEKCVREKGKTNFTRDADVKYSKVDSYKLENEDFNDSVFYQTIETTPNTAYKVSCMVKTKDIQNENTTTGGAHISIIGTTERSITLQGDNEWTKLELLFNSRNRTSIQIGFRLGGYAEKSKGIAWFSDFKMQSGVAQKNNEWKFACFIFPNINVNLNINGKQENVKLTMTDADIQDIRIDMQRFETSCEEMSQGKMKISYDLITMNEPITTLSYDEENGYYVSPEDVYALINEQVTQKEYDHIYVAIRMADKQKGSSILVNDWIGLRRYGLFRNWLFEYKTTRR